MARVEDGSGSGRTARVNDFSQLEVFAEPLEVTVLLESGRYWSASFDSVDPVGAADKFIYISNTGTRDLVITDVRMSSTVAGSVRIEKVTGTPSYVGATALDLTSRDLGTAITPSGTFNSDTNITSLTDAGSLMYIYLAANTYTQFRTSSGIWISPGTSVAFEWSASTGILTGTISILEVDRNRI